MEEWQTHAFVGGFCREVLEFVVLQTCPSQSLGRIPSGCDAGSTNQKCHKITVTAPTSRRQLRASDSSNRHSLEGWLDQFKTEEDFYHVAYSHSHKALRIEAGLSLF